MQTEIYGAALLQTIEEAGVGVLTLAEGLTDAELLGSRLTRMEVARQLRILTEAAMALPDTLRSGMPEVDWAGIGAAGSALAGPAGPELDDALVFAAKALTPATLMWLRVYRQQHPQWFQMAMP
jgi:hypothetical protein